MIEPHNPLLRPLLPHRAARAALAICALTATMIALVSLSGCGEPPKPPPPPTPTVTVTEPIEHDVVDWDDYIGTLQSPNMVNLSARVSGLVLKADFNEGSMVTKGQVLYVIDPAPFQADLDAKNAAVSQAMAQKDQAQAHFDRYEEINKTNSQAVSKDEYDTAKANLEQAKAQLKSAQAAVESSDLNLKWTKVTSPIDGRISSKYVTAGNLVNGGSGQATLLTTIVSVNPIYCIIGVPELSFENYKQLQSFQEHQNGKQKNLLPCYFQMGDEKNFPHAGHINFINNEVDPATGTITVRGVFDNPHGALVPGTYGRMRIPASGRYHAILIPDAAIGALQNERFLMIVGEDGTVSQRPVELGHLFGTLRSITSGLKEGEQVIVSGLQLAHPGMKVKTTEEPIPPQAIKALDDLVNTAEGLPSTQELPATAPTSAPVRQNRSATDQNQNQESLPNAMPGGNNGSNSAPPVSNNRAQKPQAVPRPESSQ